MLKIYLYGYLNRVHSSRRLERETQRNVELMWLTGRLMPDFKTIANFRKDNGLAVRAACRQFIVLCRLLRRAEPLAAVRTAVKPRASDVSDDEMTHGGYAWLWWWTVDAANILVGAPS